MVTRSELDMMTDATARQVVDGVMRQLQLRSPSADQLVGNILRELLVQTVAIKLIMLEACVASGMVEADTVIMQTGGESEH